MSQQSKQRDKSAYDYADKFYNKNEKYASRQSDKQRVKQQTAETSDAYGVIFHIALYQTENYAHKKPAKHHKQNLQRFLKIYYRKVDKDRIKRITRLTALNVAEHIHKKLDYA